MAFFRTWIYRIYLKNPDLINVLGGADSDVVPRTERFMANCNTTSVIF
jgi:hypothetical protein